MNLFWPIAAWLDRVGSRRIDAGKIMQGKRLYQLAIKADPSWSVPWYNLGLQTKYEGSWRESLRFNQRAVELDLEDKAAWWNLGIAATALSEWSEARRAWKAYGIVLEEGSDSDEIRWPTVSACVRLSPDESGEVVWGQRLDPARIAILSVPLPESGHRFHDVVLHDGASNGTRTNTDGTEVPVFDELSIWKVSDYSTFRVRLQIPDEDAKNLLVELCDARQIGLEDWSTIRFICAQCSRGNPGPHKCESKPLEDGSSRFGFGAKSENDLRALLEDWASEVEGATFQSIELVLSAART